jgi:hypothetical protein
LPDSWLRVPEWQDYSLEHFTAQPLQLHLILHTAQDFFLAMKPLYPKTRKNAISSPSFSGVNAPTME